jgi:membrane protein DedA with SNARE-associated domain
MLDKIAGLSHLQIDLLASLLLLEGVALAAIPEEIILLTLGVLWGQGRVGFFDSLFSAQLGLLSANFIMVMIGHKIGRQIIFKPPFSWFIKKDLVTKALAFLKSRGAVAVFITRFTPAIRGPVYLAVGISHFPILRFLKVDCFASFIHIPLILVLGRLIGRSFPIERIYSGIIMVVGISLVLTLAIVLVDYFRKRNTPLMV